MQTTSLLLTGGSSRRMGQDKASQRVSGEKLSHRIARLLSSVGFKVVVLGREPIEGFDFIPDQDEFAGALQALASFDHSALSPSTFVVACDIPRFDPHFARCAIEALENFDAAIPVLGEKLQPLCAAYSSAALSKARGLSQAGEKRVMAWVSQLTVRQLNETQLRSWGLDPLCTKSANTPQEFLELAGSE